jgi:signal transduction histidine kinase
MPARNQMLGSKWMPWVYVLFIVTQIVLVVALLQGALRDMATSREMSMRDELYGLQSRALTRAKGMEVLVEAMGPQVFEWTAVRDEPWMRNYWKQIELSGARDLYAAVIDESGSIVLHTDDQNVGQRLARGWYERRVSESRPDVVWAAASPLGGQRAAYDVMVPLTALSRPIGEYHEGIDPKWVESKIDLKQRPVSRGWLWVLISAVAVEAAACSALVYLARGHRRVWQAWKGESGQRARQMAKLGSGLAHEIRNPLHALRINLHVLRRAFGGHATLSDEQIAETISESNSAIDRLEQLMRDLLQLSDPSEGDASEINVVHEVQSAMGLLAEDLKRDQITIRYRPAADCISIAMDPVRLRQALFNLLAFAQQRAGKGGSIEVGIARREHGVEINICDSGPALTADQTERLFEPFQAPVESGTGLGLALAQMNVESVGGRASWQSTAIGGGCCRVWFPLAPTGKKGS